MYELKQANYFIEMIKRHNDKLSTNKAIFSKFQVGERFFYRFKKGERTSTPLYNKLRTEFINLKRHCAWVSAQSDINYGNIITVFGDNTARGLLEKINMNGDVITARDSVGEYRDFFFINKKYRFNDCKYIVDSILQWQKDTLAELDNELEFYDLMLAKTSAPKTLKKYLLKNIDGFY